MREEPDLRDLVGEDVTEEELRELRRIDELLRSVPGPPAEVPATLTRAVRVSTPTQPLWTRRRLSVAAALAAALAAASVGIGAWLGGNPGFEANRVIEMEVTPDAPPGASGLIRLGSAGDDGNFTLELETTGLEELAPGGYYVLWLAEEDGDYGGPCGTFRAGDDTTTVRMNASYQLDDFDEWVVTAVRPDDSEDEERPWLLHAQI